jgi:hypothetical protein
VIECMLMRSLKGFMRTGVGEPWRGCRTGKGRGREAVSGGVSGGAANGGMRQAVGWMAMQTQTAKPLQLTMEFINSSLASYHSFCGGGSGERGAHEQGRSAPGGEVASAAAAAVAA